MRLSLVKSKNATQFYVIKSFRDSNGKNTSKIIEKLGNLEEVTQKANGQDPVQWAKKYIDTLNEKEKNESLDIIAKFSPSTQIPKDIQNSYNGGYLFLQDIYYSLGLDKICNDISDKYRIKYDLNSVLANLIYTRIIEPSSKLSALKLLNLFLSNQILNFKIFTGL